jgi:hypothetical protein
MPKTKGNRKPAQSQNFYLINKGFQDGNAKENQNRTQNNRKSHLARKSSILRTKVPSCERKFDITDESLILQTKVRYYG